MTPFDHTNRESVLDYASRLEALPLRDSMVREGRPTHPADGDGWQMRRRNRDEGGSKGGFGVAVEVGYFGLDGGNHPGPDFVEIGVELKTTALKPLASGVWRPKERLKITAIDWAALADTPFEESRLALKANDMLIVFYRFDPDVTDPLDYVIDRVVSWGFGAASPEIMAVIRDDYAILQQRVRDGRAHEVSGGDTQFLEALTSGTGLLQTQPYSDEKPKQRSFALKGALLRLILEDASSLLSGVQDPVRQAMDCLVSHRGRTSGALLKEVAPGLSPNAKGINSSVTRRLLGANLVAALAAGEIKVVNMRCNSDGRPAEAVSFPAFRFKELLEEDDWYTSTCRRQMEQRILFVIWSKAESLASSELLDVFAWTIPQDALEGPVMDCWRKARVAIGDSNPGDLPGARDNPVAHVRPHGRNRSDVDVLPDGSTHTKQSFWLNQTYLQHVVNAQGVLKPRGA